MPEKKIIIMLDEQGRISAETEGFQGEACLDALQEILGSDLQISSLKTTDEFAQNAKINPTQQLKPKK